MKSGYDIKDQKQNKCIKQYGTTAAAPGEPFNFYSVWTPWFRVVVAILVIENFMAGPFAHEW